MVKRNFIEIVINLILNISLISDEICIGFSAGPCGNLQSTVSSATNKR